MKSLPIKESIIPNVTEVSRKVFATSCDGCACGPCGINSIDAEIVVIDHKHTIYFHAEWASACSDDLFIEGTTESVFVHLAKKTPSEEDIDHIKQIRETKTIPPKCVDEKYAYFCEELRQMIIAEMQAKGWQ